MSTGGGLVKIAGVDKDAVREFWEMEVDPAVWEEFRGRRNAALLGIDLARDRDLKNRYVWQEGKEFALADFDGLTLYFAGTFVPRDPTLRSVILTGDQFLEEADGRLGQVNQLLVRVAHPDQANAVAAAIPKLDFPVKLMAETQQFARDEAARDLGSMLGYARNVIFVLAVVILLGLANATSMAVRERVREIGLLRSIGFTRPKIVSVVAAESLFLSFLGGVLGCGAAWLVIRLWAQTIPAGGYSFPVTLDLPLVLVAAAGATAVGLLGGLPAGFRASRRPIVDAIRSVD